EPSGPGRDRGGQPRVGKADQAREGSREDGLAANLLRGGEVGGQDRKRAPEKGKPEIAVQAPAEELEVVRAHDEPADRDEREEPEIPGDRAADPDPDRAGKRSGRDPDQPP